MNILKSMNSIHRPTKLVYQTNNVICSRGTTLKKKILFIYHLSTLFTFSRLTIVSEKFIALKFYYLGTI